MPNDKIAALVQRINSTSNADFVKRLLDPNRKTLPAGNGQVMTHRMSYATDGRKAIVYPEVQNIDGQLVELRGRDALDSAIERRDTVMMSVPEAKKFTTHYKEYYPGFDKYGNGGSIGIEPGLLRKFETGGYAGEPDKQMNVEGGYTTPVLRRERINMQYNPTLGFNWNSWKINREYGNIAGGEENEYWRAYLGLENKVPRMNPVAKTAWDDKVEAEKVAEGKLSSDFYGTTPRMDQMIQAIADTLNTGKILRNYDEYKKYTPELADRATIEHMYNEGKKVMENPGKWTQVVEKDQQPFVLYDGIDADTGENSPLGMLADFGMMWSTDEGALRVHDTYDFPFYVRALSRIPQRPREMKIRGLVKFDPNRGSVLLRDGLDRSKYAAPIINRNAESDEIYYDGN